MAKKAVGKIRTNAEKGMAQVIIPVKSPKTGAYTFQTSFVSSEEVKQLLAKAKQ